MSKRNSLICLLYGGLGIGYIAALSYLYIPSANELKADKGAPHVHLKQPDDKESIDVE